MFFFSVSISFHPSLRWELALPKEQGTIAFILDKVFHALPRFRFPTETKELSPVLLALLWGFESAPELRRIHISGTVPELTQLSLPGWDPSFVYITNYSPRNTSTALLPAGQESRELGLEKIKQKDCRADFAAAQRNQLALSHACRRRRFTSQAGDCVRSRLRSDNSICFVPLWWLA